VGSKTTFQKIIFGVSKIFCKNYFPYFSYSSRQFNLRAKRLFKKYGVVQEILPLKDKVTFRLKILGI
jgi:hypothetical protein